MRIDVVESVPVLDSLHVVTLVEVLVNDHIETILDEIIGGAVSMDSGSASRSNLNLDIPATPELIPIDLDSLLAPNGNELRVSRGRALADRWEVVHLGVFRIDRSTYDDSGADRKITIEASDRSARFIDSKFEIPGIIASGSDALDSILSILQLDWPDMPYDSADFSGSSAPLPRLAYQEEDDKWELCQGIATAIGRELYFNKSGILRCMPVANSVGVEPSYVLKEGEEGDLVQVNRDMDRDKSFNKIIVPAENTINDLPIARGEAIDNNASSPTYYYGKFGPKPHWARSISPFISSTVQANDAAAGILARAIGTPDTINFGALVNPSLAPSSVIQIERSWLGATSNYIVDGLSIPLGYGETMTGTTRNVELIG